MRTDSENSIAFIGSYTLTESNADGKSAGVSIYKTGPKPSDWNLLSFFSDIINPSYLCLSPSHPIIYTVSEQGGQAPAPKSVIKVIQYDADNYVMTELQEISAEGDAPCYISTDREGKFLYVANYLSGNVIQYKINDDGSLQPGIAVQHYGSGIHSRQEAPHAHYIHQHPSDDNIYAVDLGTNKIIRYSSSIEGLKQEGFISSEPGSGPRHLAWHPNGKMVYVLNELSGTLEGWEWTDNFSKRHQIIQLNPFPDSLDAGSADIHLSKDGQFIYTSLRGDFNEIIALSIDPESHQLAIIQRVDAGGLAPRNFTLSPDEDYLAVALQNSDRIVLFPRDKNTGLLGESSGTVDVMTPVCVVFK